MNLDGAYIELGVGLGVDSLKRPEQRQGKQRGRFLERDSYHLRPGQSGGRDC